MTNQEWAEHHYRKILEIINGVENNRYVGNDVAFAIAMGQLMSHFEFLNRFAMDGYLPDQWRQ